MNKINLYPKDELLKAIQAGAEKENRSMNNYILTILKHFCLEHPELLGLRE